MNKRVSYKFISDDKVLVTYVPKLYYDVIKSHNLYICFFINKYN